MSNVSRTLRQMNQRNVKQVRTAVCKVLWEQWDPIGVNDDPQAFGEYDAYANGVCLLLLRGASDSEVISHLRHTETVNMGCPASDQECLAVVVGALRGISLKTPSV